MITAQQGRSHVAVMGLQIDINTTDQLTLKVLVTTIDAQWQGMGDVGLVRYEPALLPPCRTITSKFSEIQHFKG